MSEYAITAAKTSQLMTVFLQDSSSATGAGLTGLAWDTAGLTVYYFRSDGTAAVQVTPLANMTLGTWVSGGFKKVDDTNMPGLYQFGIPNAALAANATEVTLCFRGATNLMPRHVKIPLRSFDQTATGVTVATNGITSGSIQDGALTSAKFANDGTAQAGGSTSITLAAGAASGTDYYANKVVEIVAGTGAGQNRLITAYNGTSKVATVDRAWVTNPDATSQYLLTAQGPAYVHSMSAAQLTAFQSSVWTKVVEAEGGYTAQQALDLIFAASVGRSSSSGTIFSTPNNNATRVTATVDGSNNRTAITLNPST
jgi:hypothetical protein